ncbi:MAG: hypothetical protein V4574_00640 [Pseudomonadota bacterium]
MIRKLLGLLLLLAAPGVAHAEWHEASTPHFIVYSDEKPERLKVFATQLVRFDKALRFLRNLPDAPIGDANRVTVFVVGGTGTISRLANDRFVAGFYAGRAGGSVAFVPRRSGDGSEHDLSPQAILLHEYTHHFLLSLSEEAAYPGWFVEGYAEFFAASSFEADGAFFFGRPPLYRAQGLLGHGNLLPMNKLLNSDALKLNDEQREGLYGRGWLLTHYLFLGGKREGQLGAYLNALNAGTPPLDAAKVFGDLRTLDKELDRYLLGRLSARRIDPRVLAIGEISVRKLRPAEADTMAVRIRSKSGVNQKIAPDVYAAARKACAPYPNDPAAQRVLTEAAYDARDFAGAEAAADRILAAEPRSVDALLYKAWAKAGIAEKAGDRSAPTWTAIRKLIATANRIDPENPEPLWYYFQAYERAGVTPPKLARDGLYYAFQLAPQDPGLRFAAARSYLQDGNAAKARALLTTLAWDPHRGGIAAVAAKLIAEIDAGHADTALRDLEKQSEDAAKPEGS